VQTPQPETSHGTTGREKGSGNDLDEKARTRRLDLEVINIGLMTATTD
jgi:hypothetical protein